jgi:biopolymer transport protein ExbD
MPKIKMPKSSPSLDMTPMVDLAFLLVTFFMLTAQFRGEEPVIVDIPASQKEIPIPDRDIMTITIDSADRVFFNIDNKAVRANLLKKMGEKYNVSFTEEQTKTFSLMNSFGVPMNNLAEFISANEGGREKMNKQTKGIPVDSANAATNQLRDWIIFGRLASAEFHRDKGEANVSKLRFAIKGDARANYEIINAILKTFQRTDINVNQFNLLTDLEGKVTAE